MKVSWVNHGLSSSKEPLAIYSVDIQPSGNRFASGGADFKVKIWNLAPLRIQASSSSSSNNNSNRLLATLADHEGVVNIVRWSHSGHALATGADDRTVLIWQHFPEAQPTSVLGEVPSIECWRRMITLADHSADITDLCWSPDDSKLASASFDSSVIVWDLLSGTRIHRLTHHTGVVKGIAWDPLNKYVFPQKTNKIKKHLQYSFSFFFISSSSSFFFSEKKDFWHLKV